MNASPNPNPSNHDDDDIAPVHGIGPVTGGAVDRLAAAAERSRRPRNARFVADRVGGSRALVPNLDAPWLDVAEQRLRDLLDDEQPTLPPELAELLASGDRDRLRLQLWTHLRAEHLDAVTGGCEMPWTGCPDHGDLLEHGVIAGRWRCTMPGHDFTLESTFARLRHCQRPAVAVLVGEPGESEGLPVCAGHAYSERDRASHGGDAVYVTPLTAFPEAA
ncbi:hypothetical protein [Nocardia heshunensis]